MAFSELIENYPGFPDGISGMELSRQLEDHAGKFGAEIRPDLITGISRAAGGAIKAQSNSGAYTADAVILAVGSVPRKLNIPGEKKFTGKGVSYCALCDGPFFSGQDIAVIGGGDTAVHEAIMLSKFAAKVYLVHRRRTLRAAKSLRDKFFSLGNGEFIPQATVASIEGGSTVETIRLRCADNGKEKEISLRGVFIAAGYEPDTVFLRNSVPLDDCGYIITGTGFSTETEGVFACGDAVSGTLKQVVSACASGAAAAVSATDYVDNLKGKAYG